MKNFQKKLQIFCIKRSCSFAPASRVTLSDERRKKDTHVRRHIELTALTEMLDKRIRVINREIKE
jgi:hypothetical protein